MTDTGEERPGGEEHPGGDQRPGSVRSAVVPGGSIFTLEGRAAPGLYMVGWLASIMGGAILLVWAFADITGITSAGLVLGGCALLALGLTSAAGSQSLERRAQGAQGYRGPSPVLVFAAAIPITIIIVVLVLVPASLVGVTSDSTAAAFLSIGVTGLVYLGLVGFLVVGTGALRWAEMGLSRPGQMIAEDLFWSALLALPVILVTALVVDVVIEIVGAVPESPLPTAHTSTDLVLNFLAAALVAPLGEELFFRGFATTAWMRSAGERSAIVRGALFFAIAHVLTVGGATFAEAFGRAVVAFVGRLPVSFTLGWVYVRRRSLYASIALHATFNGLLVILGEAATRSVGFGRLF